MIHAERNTAIGNDYKLYILYIPSVCTSSVIDEFHIYHAE